MSEAEAPPRTRINVISLFPEVMAPYLAASIPARAVEKGLVEFRLVQLRDYATDRHRTVDDTPYGGGAGDGDQAGCRVCGGRVTG